jgi:arylsulfatase A-like enzyme
MKVKLLIISIFLFASATFAGPKPNIVHIMVDDLGWQDIAAHKIGGDAVYETPNLDRLTKTGRRFTEAYYPAHIRVRSR